MDTESTSAGRTDSDADPQGGRERETSSRLGQATRPAILVIEEEPLVDVLADDLRLRFAGEFRVLHEGRADKGLRALEGLAAERAPVALVIAGDSIGGTDGGVEILAGAKNLHPLAKRVLLVGRNYTPTNPVVKAMTLGQIDFHLTKPWRRDKTLYPAVTEFLASWTAAHDTPSGGIFHIVGPRDTPRALEIREILMSMGMPGAIACDEGGYILTGRDLEHGTDPGQWPLERPPLSLETSVPGVFAAGDVRSRSVKRVASAVGEARRPCRCFTSSSASSRRRPQWREQSSPWPRRRVKSRTRMTSQTQSDRSLIGCAPNSP